MENNGIRTKMNTVSEAFSMINVDCSDTMVAQWALSCLADDNDMDKLLKLLETIKKSIDERRIAILSSMSRIPQVHRKTFQNFKVERLSPNNTEVIEHLKTLDFLNAGENILLVGDPGTGKTHIAQAIGNLCIDNLISVRYYKMSELHDKLRKASESDRIKTFMDNLINVPCLIIDEVGYCNRFSEPETNLFFQILDRRYDKRKGSTVFTSNKMPMDWKDMFSDPMIALCSLDRIMDRYIAIEIKGASYRGTCKKVFKLNCSNNPQINGMTI